ncbi:hypothetical protein BLA29_011518 [Euroglyphus maynei]|uniref:Uncharacterized protein n=1 Tax=Euroglyphus maynei TaxID=6958 RepID=A0A1Y3B5H1_EURMA|nr:hypothetical protein BLA29_011518 [Euroglyphus maynei]
MVTPAMQLASKIPDTQVQLWATALLKDLYDSGSAKQAEAIQMHNQFSQILLNDQYQALHLNEHGYINVSQFVVDFFYIFSSFHSLPTDSGIANVD